MITFKDFNLVRIKTLITFIVFFFILFSSNAEARTVVRSGAAVSIADDEKIEGDFYTAANIINLSGEVGADMVSVGFKTTVNGSVGDDALLIAGQADVYGTVGDDLRIVAGEVVIAEPVLGDIFVIAGSVSILSTASVSGDVLIYAGRADISGSVGGNILGFAEELRVDGQVAGDVDVTVTELTLGDRAVISGSVKYTSLKPLTQSLNSSVAGNVLRNDPILPKGDFTLRSTIVPMLMLLFSVLVWYLVGRRFLNKLVNRALVRKPQPVLFGLLTLIFAPLAIGVLLVSVIGIFVGIAGLFGYLLLCVLGLVGSPAIMGHFLMKIFNQPSRELSLVSLLVGVLGTSLLILLPVVGQFAFALLIVLALGAMVDILLYPNER